MAKKNSYAAKKDLNNDNNVVIPKISNDWMEIQNNFNIDEFYNIEIFKKFFNKINELISPTYQSYSQNPHIPVKRRLLST